MSEVARYTISESVRLPHGLIFGPGEYVKASDYDALAARLAERLATAAQRAVNFLDSHLGDTDPIDVDFDEYEQPIVDALRTLVAALADVPEPHSPVGQAHSPVDATPPAPCPEDRSDPPPGYYIEQNPNRHNPWCGARTAFFSSSYRTEAEAIAACWRDYDKAATPTPCPECERLLAKVNALADLWERQQRSYSPDRDGEVAAATVRCCVKELRAELAPDRPAEEPGREEGAP